MEDSAQTLKVLATTAQSTQSDTTLSFSYTDAATGTNQYISCVLVDNSGAVKYYGKLADSSSAASGALSVPLSGVADGTYTLKLFSEQANGDMYTDFAGTPIEMGLSVSSGTGTVSSFGGIALPSNDASLVSVAGQSISAAGSGTLGAPKTAGITVANSVSAIAEADITAATDASVKLYSDSAFATEESVNLNEGGGNHLYIKVTAQDGTILYYDVTVTRDADPDIPTVAVAQVKANNALYNTMTQAAASSETVIVNALKDAAAAAVDDNTVTVTIHSVGLGYQLPIAGDADNVNGVNGRYHFKVTVTKGAQSQDTGLKSIDITATLFAGLSNADAVAAAKAAIVNGAVNVSFGADQADKTAAVQSYVNSLLTGDAAGVTATVTYSSGNQYNIALAKGSASGSKSIAMTVNEAPDPDIATVNSAFNAVNSAPFEDINQDASTDETIVSNRIKGISIARINNPTVNVTITPVSTGYVVPTAGNAGNPSGTNGSYTFTVKVSKGVQSQTTAQKAITIIAAPFSPNALNGTATISNPNPRIGDTLTGSLAGDNNTGTLTYVWKAGVSQVGADTSYAVALTDLGKTITLEITSNVETGKVTSAPTAAVAKKAAPPTPNAPTLSSKTHSSVTLMPNTAYEFSKDGTAWQTNNEFTGLTANTAYTFYQRIAATDDTEGSAASIKLDVATESAPSATLQSIAITTPANKLIYTVGESLDISGIVVTGTYSDSSAKTETVTAANVTGFDSSAPAAKQTLTVTVGGKAVTYTVTISPAPVISATISPASANYDLASPTDIKINITWNSANTVTDVVYATASMAAPADYTVSGNVLTIKTGYLAAKSFTAGDKADFTISFDKGNPATFTVDIIYNHIPGSNADLSDLTVGGSTVSGFDPNTLSYDVELPYGILPGGTAARVNATADDSKAGVSILQAANLPGSATVEVTAENGTTKKTYTISFTRGTAPNVSVTGISLNASNLSLYSNTTSNTASLVATVSPSNAANQAVAWASGNLTVATVDASGKVTAMGNGTAVITATTADGGYTASCIVTVTTYPGGGTDNGGGGYTPAPPASNVVTEKQPDMPTAGTTPVTATAGANGTASASVSDQVITDAISKAQADAKAQGNLSNGIAVELNLTMPQGAASLSVLLSQNALQSLVSAGVTSLTINGSPVKVTFDLKALQEIQRQSNGTVNISIAPQAKLSASARGMIGTRPAYDLTVGYGSGRTVSGFGGGMATVSVPYTPAKGEAVGALYAVYVDEKGNATRIAGSAYDANSRSIIFTTTHFSLYGVGYTAPSAKFTDVANHWAKESIDYVVGRGVLSGTSKTTFAPNAAMTPGMLVTALGRLAGVDVKADSVFRPYIEWAYKRGLTQGTGNGKFEPDRAITREEIALILQNFAKATGYKLPVTREAVTYADASNISSVYKAAVMAMQQAGIMMGGTGNKFNPKSSATRAEVSSMLHRYIKLTIDPATAQGWVLNDAGQYLYYEDGKALTGWQTIDGVKYFFETTGVLKTGWVKDGGKWRYYSGNTSLTGWWEIGGKWYYFYTDGSLAKNTKVDGYEVDENGVRKTK